MKTFLVSLAVAGNIYAADFEDKAITNSVIDLIEALKKSRILDNNFTTHKFEIEHLKGKALDLTSSSRHMTLVSHP